MLLSEWLGREGRGGSALIVARTGIRWATLSAVIHGTVPRWATAQKISDGTEGEVSPEDVIRESVALCEALEGDGSGLVLADDEHGHEPHL